MKSSQALESKCMAIRQLVGRFRAVNPRVFGSVLNGTDCEGSDLDFMVDTLPGTTLFDLGGSPTGMRVNHLADFLEHI
jgi:predicted nucleotidyltransferase